VQNQSLCILRYYLNICSKGLKKSRHSRDSVPGLRIEHGISRMRRIMMKLRNKYLNFHILIIYPYFSLSELVMVFIIFKHLAKPPVSAVSHYRLGQISLNSVVETLCSGWLNCAYKRKSPNLLVKVYYFLCRFSEIEKDAVSCVKRLFQCHTLANNVVSSSVYGLVLLRIDIKTQFSW